MAPNGSRRSGVIWFAARRANRAVPRRWPSFLPRDSTGNMPVAQQAAIPGQRITHCGCCKRQCKRLLGRFSCQAPASCTVVHADLRCCPQGATAAGPNQQAFLWQRHTSKHRDMRKCTRRRSLSHLRQPVSIGKNNASCVVAGFARGGCREELRRGDCAGRVRQRTGTTQPLQGGVFSCRSRNSIRAG